MRKDSPDKKAAALQATLELISEQGFHAAPMSQIAKRANIGVGTIYRYFAGKEDLINALYIDIKTRMVRHILDADWEIQPVREVFHRLLSGIVRYCLGHPAELSFIEQYENSPLLTAATHAEISRLIEPWERLYQRARAENLLKDLAFEILGSLLMGALISLVKGYLSGAVQFNEEKFAGAIDALWDMVKRKGVC
jgi:AcrR family transcriptional regulator